MKNTRTKLKIASRVSDMQMREMSNEKQACPNLKQFERIQTSLVLLSCFVFQPPVFFDDQGATTHGSALNRNIRGSSVASGISPPC